MRLDKLLANQGWGSRKEVHQLIKRGLVTVNGEVVLKKDAPIAEDRDDIRVQGEVVSKQMVHYIAFNKPTGYVTALDDRRHPVVMELLPPVFAKLGISPVGRLDKDTEGLLLLTNDGAWAHRIIHGKKEVPKVYDVQYDGTLDAKGIDRIEEGIVLGDGTACKPAQVRLLKPGYCEVTITEGKYHQVKRMIGACGGNVTALRRLSVGTITLDGIDKPGQYRALQSDEIEKMG